MTGRTTAPLTEVLKLLQRQVVTGEVEQTVKQHRTVARGQDEPVTVGPGRVAWIMLEETSPEHIGHVCHPHWHTRMTGLGFLHAVHGQRADGVDTELVKVDDHRLFLSITW
jgi:hypothetical protein